MTLEQLSAAATQGEWSVFEYDAGSYIYDAGGFPTPSIQCEEADCAIVHWDGFKQEYWVSANGNAKQIEANAAFICQLVNLYRTGQLVAVADDVVERVAELQLAAFLAGRGSVTSMKHGTRSAKPAPTMEQFRQMAIAAMKDPKL